MFEFGKISITKLITVHPKLREVCNLAIIISNQDFSIIEGYRSVERQQILYKQGRTEPGKIVTKIDGIKKKSKHNYIPSLAVDVAPYVDGQIVWDLKYYPSIIEAFKTASKELGIKISCGADWTGDFVDAPHIELVV